MRKTTKSPKGTDIKLNVAFKAGAISYNIGIGSCLQGGLLDSTIPKLQSLEWWAFSSSPV